MKLFRINSLQHRLVIFLLIPVVLLLFGVGFRGFIFARDIMLNAWRDGAIVKLERAAHYIDMRLGRPMELMDLLGESEGTGVSPDPEWILGRIRKLDGVTRVELTWTEKGSMPMRGTESQMGSRHMMQFHRIRIFKVTPPHFDARMGRKTVTLLFRLEDESGRKLASLEVSIRFDYLLEDIQRLGWWQSDKACLIDDAGRFLAHTRGMMSERRRLGETDDPLELAVLEAMGQRPSGTLLGKGHPPKQVCGFYRLRNAPWTIVLTAPGKKVLAPIVRYRFYYFLAGTVSILIIIVLIRFVVGRMVHSIREVSRASEKVAKGEYGDLLPVTSYDEIGQLTESFNTMVSGLKERDFIRDTFGRYVDREIAKELMKRPEAARLGGEKREVVVLMSDLRNFTSLAESLSPEETIHLLNHYFSHMIKVIERYRGIIVDFFGDGLLVFFDPLDAPVGPSAGRALACALGMQAGMTEINDQHRREGLPELQMGIGLNAGEVVVGNIGSVTRAKYGIVGAPVNLTDRIQAVAQPGEVVITRPVLDRLLEKPFVKKSFTVEVKGVKDPVKIYVVGEPAKGPE